MYDCIFFKYKFLISDPLAVDMDRQLRYLHHNFDHQIKNLMDADYLYIRCLVLTRTILARTPEDSLQRDALVASIADLNLYLSRNTILKNELIETYIRTYLLCLNYFE